MKPCVLTPFERAVLKAALDIPLGETRTYAWIAQRIGRPGAVRAVGQALRKNPYPLIIPCHRVVRSDGTLGKYAGRDDGRKKELIDQERCIRDLLSL
jgi:O-6-methylguanine DNA methyltransferase